MSICCDSHVIGSSDDGNNTLETFVIMSSYINPLSLGSVYIPFKASSTQFPGVTLSIPHLFCTHSHPSVLLSLESGPNINEPLKSPYGKHSGVYFSIFFFVHQNSIHFGRVAKFLLNTNISNSCRAPSIELMPSS